MNTDMDWVDLVTRMGHFHDINVALNQGGGELNDLRVC